jgi:ACS family tartrate transporter-like MFS transporter
MILAASTGLDVTKVGYLVSIGGVIGTGATLYLGNLADRNGDRFILGFWCAVVMAASLFTIWLAPSPLMVGIAYLAFSTVGFAVSMLISSAWAEALHVRELAVGAAAINTLSQIGAFVTPFAWGAAKDAMGNFDTGLIGITLMMVVNAGLILLLRHQIRGRSLRPATA